MYTVYRITNVLNSKTYIGVHLTSNPNDDYMGSGIAIRNAIKKHGKQNFFKEVIHITESKEKAYSIEKELTQNYSSNSNYNLKQGGVGGFTKEASWKGHIARSKKGGRKVADLKLGMFSNQAENGKRGGQTNKGRKLSQEHKDKIRQTLLKRLKTGRQEV
jgi:hypothetical protein